MTIEMISRFSCRILSEMPSAHFLGIRLFLRVLLRTRNIYRRNPCPFRNSIMPCSLYRLPWRRADPSWCVRLWTWRAFRWDWRPVIAIVPCSNIRACYPPCGIKIANWVQLPWTSAMTQRYQAQLSVVYYKIYLLEVQLVSSVVRGRNARMRFNNVTTKLFILLSCLSTGRR